MLSNAYRIGDSDRLDDRRRKHTAVVPLRLNALDRRHPGRVRDEPVDLH